MRTLSGEPDIRLRRKTLANTATAVPMHNPPAETVTSDTAASPRENCAVTAAATATLNATSATASLSRLSPLKRICRRGGRGMRLTTPLTATVSVDARAAANAMATASGISGSRACRP